MIKKSFLAFCLIVLCSNLFAQSGTYNYEALKDNIISKRDSLLDNYLECIEEQKDSIIDLSRSFLINKISNDLFLLWYGTPWDFEGHTKIPQKGQIACGYFVTNILTDVGFNIPRIKWAQIASETVILKLAPNDHKRFINKPIQDIENYLATVENGLFLVGLDNHVGFILKNEDSTRFIHANYYEPDKGVMSQKINSYNPLKHSKYRIIGRLLTDDMILKWLMNTEYR